MKLVFYLIYIIFIGTIKQYSLFRAKNDVSFIKTQTSVINGENQMIKLTLQVSSFINKVNWAMLPGREIVMSLKRLTLPADLKVVKVSLSAATSGHQVFIRSARIIRNHTINFFRELLFLPHDSDQLSFRIYQLDDAERKILLKELSLSREDLNSLDLKPMSIRLQDRGFQLLLDVWMFSEESEDLNSLTDRDYSELNLTFDNKEESSLTTALPNPQYQNDQQNSTIELQKLDQRKRKSVIFVFQQEDQNKKVNIDRVLLLKCQKFKKVNEGIQICGKNTIKSNVCEKLIKELSGLFF